MFDIQHYSSFVLAILVFQAMPGVGTIAILGATAQGGLRGGFAAVAGTLLGDLCYMLAAIAGLAALMSAYPALFLALRWSGVAYLCWMGLQLLRQPGATGGPSATTSPGPWQHCRRAFVVALSNPKVILFFVAFFPLFLRPGASVVTLFALVAHVSCLSLAYQTLLVFAGHALARRLRAWPGARVVALRVAGLALLGFGVKLAVASR